MKRFLPLRSQEWLFWLVIVFYNMQMMVNLTITDKPELDEIAAIGANLSAFNDADVGPAEKTPMAG